MQKRDVQFLSFTLLALYLILVVRNAWTSDDSFITFRSVENFLAGYGPVYNPTMRVQGFTHPLWMFLIAAAYFIAYHSHLTFGDGPVFPTLFLSLLCSSLAVFLAMRKIVKNELIPLLLLFAPLVLSRAFIDYSTSGLENPLTDLLLVLFVWKFLDESPNFFLLALIASGIALNRMDALLLVGPALIYEFWLQRRSWRRNLGSLFLGFLPFLLWEIFSLFYYGFLFPNTAYAKLNTGVPANLLILQGLDYVLNSINWDPLTLFVIVLAGGLVFLERDKKSISVYLGVLLYFAYTIKIGGDFMSGRYFAASLLLSALLISRVQSVDPRVALAAWAVMLLLGVFSLRSTLLDPSEALISGNINQLIDQNGIADERLVYFGRDRDSGLVVLGFRDPQHAHPFTAGNWVFTGVQRVDVETTLGLSGYDQGPNVLVVDRPALTDPLLARLPAEDPNGWRIGHFLRAIPAGYINTLHGGTNRISDPNLAAYYDKLSFIISGPLWNGDRLLDIWKFNTGQYDTLLKAYLATLTPNHQESE